MGQEGDEGHLAGMGRRGQDGVGTMFDLGRCEARPPASQGGTHMERRSPRSRAGVEGQLIPAAASRRRAPAWRSSSCRRSWGPSQPVGLAYRYKQARPSCHAEAGQRLTQQPVSSHTVRDRQPLTACKPSSVQAAPRTCTRPEPPPMAVSLGMKGSTSCVGKKP